jgi:uncharacterized membrane protein
MAGTSDPPPPSATGQRLVERMVPFWEPQLVVLVAIGIDFALPNRLTLFGRWLLPGVEATLLLALVLVTPHPRLRHSRLRRRLALGMTGFVSLVNAVSLVLLVHFLLKGKSESGRQLILAGGGLWLTNILLFGLWYWEIDRGGPLARRTDAPADPDFLFPQMSEPEFAPSDWDPGLVDYLYVSFTNAAAFSPTDTMPLTQQAKALMGAQSLIALVTIGLVVARAVNILS